MSLEQKRIKKKHQPLSRDEQAELRKETVRRLLTWHIQCADCGLLESVIKEQRALIESLTLEVDRLSRRARSRQSAKLFKRKRQRPTGHVYIVRSAKLCKIGYAGDLMQRLRSINTCTPDQCELVVKFETEAAPIFEQYLHAKFASKQVKGEWFKLTAKDIEWLRAFAALTNEQRAPFIESFKE